MEQDVVPVGPYRLPGPGRDGVMVLRERALTRVLWVGDEQCTVRAWATGRAVRIRAEGASQEGCEAATGRMRFALGTDHDLSEFHRRFRWDPLIGPVIRRKPYLRPRRRPEPFEALAWAVCEQLIRVRPRGRDPAPDRAPARTTERLRDAAGAALGGLPRGALASRARRVRARAEALDRARRRAREVASGRADLSENEPAWRRLRSIPNIGNWTLEMLAVTGQGRDDQLPALDVAYLKFVGAAAGLGRRATEEEVREFFAPYGEYAALAGCYALQRRFR